MKDDLRAYRERELCYPTHNTVGSRLPKNYEVRLRTMALMLDTTPSALLRFLAAKGAEAYGVDMLAVK